MLGGTLHAYVSLNAVFLVCAGLCVVWFLVAFNMKAPRGASSFLFKVGEVDQIKATALSRELMLVTGVKEVVIRAEDGVAYLKVDSALFEPHLVEPFKAK